MSACCTKDDMTRNQACINAPLCSWNVTVPAHQAQVCPLEKYACSRDDSDIVLSMNQTESVIIGRLFDETDTCHYTLSAADNSAKVEKYNRKWLQVYVESFDGLDIYVSNATNARSINNATIVS